MDISDVLTRYLLYTKIRMVGGDGWNQIDIPLRLLKQALRSSDPQQPRTQLPSLLYISLRFSAAWGNEICMHSMAQGTDLEWVSFTYI